MCHSDIKFQRREVAIVNGLLRKMAMEIHHQGLVVRPDRAYFEPHAVVRLKLSSVRPWIFLRHSAFQPAIAGFLLVIKPHYHSSLGKSRPPVLYAIAQAVVCDLKARGTYSQLGSSVKASPVIA